METFTLTAADGTALTAYRWPVDDPRGVVQVAHGMAEHARRYDRFAQALNRAGYAVYAQDFRGHGQTAGSVENTGHFADENGWATVVEDMTLLTRTAREELPGTPLVLLGHSMGSMLGRSYAIAHSGDIDALVLSGTAADPGMLGKVGGLVATVEGRLRGKRARSTLMDNMTFGSYGKAFKPNRTKFDWLSRDDAEVDKYVADPFCGNVHTTRFFADILGGLAEINDAAKVSRIRKDLPILVFSGSMDPVGGPSTGSGTGAGLSIGSGTGAGPSTGSGSGAGPSTGSGTGPSGVQAVVRQLREAGITDVTEVYYPDARHETLNETNRDEVTADVVAWLDAHS